MSLVGTLTFFVAWQYEIEFGGELRHSELGTVAGWASAFATVALLWWTHRLWQRERRAIYEAYAGEQKAAVYGAFMASAARLVNSCDALSRLHAQQGQRVAATSERINSATEDLVDSMQRITMVGSDAAVEAANRILELWNIEVSPVIGPGASETLDEREKRVDILLHATMRFAQQARSEVNPGLNEALLTGLSAQNTILLAEDAADQRDRGSKG